MEKGKAFLQLRPVQGPWERKEGRNCLQVEGQCGWGLARGEELDLERNFRASKRFSC